NTGNVDSSMTLRRYANNNCTGGLSNVNGAFYWTDTTTVIFAPTAALAANTCYPISISTRAPDWAGNALAAPFTSTSVTANRTRPPPPLPGSVKGSLFSPGAAAAATGTSWTAGSGNVSANWETGTALGSAAPASGNVTINFSLPTNPTAGSHSLVFTRSGGGM